MVSWAFVDIDSGNGLLPDGTKPLPETMLTYHHKGPEGIIIRFEDTIRENKTENFISKSYPDLPETNELTHFPLGALTTVSN